MEAGLSGGAPGGTGTEPTPSSTGHCWNGHDGRALADFVAACKASGADGVIEYGAIRMKVYGAPDASLKQKTAELQDSTVSVRMAELERRAGRQADQAAKQRERKKRQKQRARAAKAAEPADARSSAANR